MKKTNLTIKCANPKCKNTIDFNYYDPMDYAYKVFDHKTKKIKYYCSHNCCEQAKIQKERDLTPKSMRSKFLLNQVVTIKKGNTPFQQDFCNKIGRIYDIFKKGKKFIYTVNFNGSLISGIDEKLIVLKR